MTEFLNKSFSVGMAGDQQYRDNWERIFGKKEATEMPSPEEPPKCAVCQRPATCFGSYDGALANFACDTCCGHGCEDGSCTPLPLSGGKPGDERCLKCGGALVPFRGAERATPGSSKEKEPEPQSEPEPCSCAPCSLCPEGKCDCLPCGCCGTQGCICYTRG